MDKERAPKLEVFPSLYKGRSLQLKKFSSLGKELILKRGYSIRKEITSRGGGGMEWGRVELGRDKHFCLKLSQGLYYMYANSKGSGETVLMHKLASAFAGPLCDK